MVEREPGWKQALKEPNAIGWIALMVLVVAIGFGALYLGGSTPDVGSHTTTVGSGQMAK